MCKCVDMQINYTIALILSFVILNDLKHLIADLTIVYAKFVNRSFAITQYEKVKFPLAQVKHSVTCLKTCASF